MLSFLQSGWFWLLLSSLLLILASCIFLPKSTPSPEPSTASPLPQFTLIPFATETLQLRVLSPSITLDYVPPIPTNQRQMGSARDEDIYATTPTCFTSPNAGYSCLGRIWNNSENPIGSPILAVNLLNEQGQVLAQSEILLEQSFINSGEFAPYRALIELSEPSYTYAEAHIERIIQPLPQLASLTIIDSRGQMNATGRYRLTATIQNQLEETAYNVRLFASLVDDNDRLVGYRIYLVEEEIEAGERRILEMEIIPHAIPEHISHTLHIEAQSNAE